MSRTSMMTIGKVWLTAGLASVLAACVSMGPSASSAQWPTATDVVATAPACTPAGLQSLDALLANGTIVAGTPDQVIAKMRWWLEQTRPGMLMLWPYDGRLPQKKALRSLELLGKEVLPALREIGRDLGAGRADDGGLDRVAHPRIGECLRDDLRPDAARVTERESETRAACHRTHYETRYGTRLGGAGAAAGSSNSTRT